MKKLFIVLLALFMTGCTVQPEKSDITANTMPENEAISPYEGFSLGSYYPPDENIQPMSFKIENPDSIYTYNPEKAEIAISELKTGDYYLMVQKSSEKYFTYENGEYAIIPENQDFTTETYLRFFDDSDKAFTVKPQLAITVNAAFDGEYNEAVFCYTLPLCADLPYETKATDTYCITVYVNHRNEAIILNDASAQTVTDITPLYYEDGSIHLMFTWGETSESSRSSIISFKNGSATTEYIGGKVLLDKKNGLFHSLTGGEHNGRYLFFREKNNGYCNVSAEPLTGEALEIICSSEAVSESFPDMRDRNPVVIGGKYITVDNNTFIFEDGTPEIQSYLILPPENGFYGVFSHSFNINTNLP